MSLKHNIAANYVSQLYVTIIGIVMVPIYVRYMGAEAYGLVGFYAMLQAWFQLLDMGLTPTMARETSRFNGGATDALSLRRLLRALEGIFFAVALIGGGLIVLLSGSIARSWLKVETLPLAEVRHAIVMMGFIIALRWICGLYRGAINGFEGLVWLSTFNIAIATARFVFVVPLFIYVGPSPTQFFAYQFVVAIVEAFVLIAKTYSSLPTSPKGDLRARWQWEPLRGVLKFSLSVAFTSSVWILVTQTDKLILSKLLPLGQYAYFALAVLVAGGVTIVSVPISGALLPRLTRLAAEGNDVGLVRLYRHATQLVGIISISAALVLAFFAEEILWAWTGNADVARNAAPILRLYAIGNGILALGAFPYYLQYAKGDMKLHLFGNILFVVLLIPSLIYATIRVGAVGAGYAWVSANAIYFLVWVPRVHRRFVKDLHWRWVRRDIAPIILITLTGAIGARNLLRFPDGRIEAGLLIFAISITMLLIAVAGSSFARSKICAFWFACFGEARA